MCVFVHFTVYLKPSFYILNSSRSFWSSSFCLNTLTQCRVTGWLDIWGNATLNRCSQCCHTCSLSPETKLGLVFAFITPVGFPTSFFFFNLLSSGCNGCSSLTAFPCCAFWGEVTSQWNLACIVIKILCCPHTIQSRCTFGRYKDVGSKNVVLTARFPAEMRYRHFWAWWGRKSHSAEAQGSILQMLTQSELILRGSIEVMLGLKGLPWSGGLKPLPQTAAFTACSDFCPHMPNSLCSVKLTSP